ncbi:hypothetical protein HNR60_002814 [Rhodopseudomonas rhenobacensis]|uniref:Uncharacterized protein n=1 Tax=Rhodopseudomonas rhenobacensis TaxID=87461 RepID=A0A7W7Z4V7_9BRAD|nr:hypothetical protein [Rhodopseudomonas rhenobacensis]MBB5048053.1 hypothetical protein [Rhodopseudomonas rhenobacensis]
MLQMLGREDFPQKRIRDLIVSDFADFRDARDGDGISAVYEWMIHQRERLYSYSDNFALEAPTRRAAAHGERERRLFEGEEDAITRAIEKPSVYPIHRQWRAARSRWSPRSSHRRAAR